MFVLGGIARYLWRKILAYIQTVALEHCRSQEQDPPRSSIGSNLRVGTKLSTVVSEIFEIARTKGLQCD